MMPRMKMNTFPFDHQTLKFTLGPWTHSVATQNTTFPTNGDTRQDDQALFMSLQGTDDNETGSTYAETMETDKYIATEEWDYRGFSARRYESKFACCPDKFVTMVGRIRLKRASHFYVKFGVLPQVSNSLALTSKPETPHQALISPPPHFSTQNPTPQVIDAHAILLIRQLL
jgi:hypothetical protein